MKLNIKENMSENQVEYKISNVIEYCWSSSASHCSIQWWVYLTWLYMCIQCEMHLISLLKSVRKKN
jgi:hypothetical protein